MEEKGSGCRGTLAALRPNAKELRVVTFGNLAFVLGGLEEQN